MNKLYLLMLTGTILVVELSAVYGLTCFSNYGRLHFEHCSGTCFRAVKRSGEQRCGCYDIFIPTSCRQFNQETVCYCNTNFCNRPVPQLGQKAGFIYNADGPVPRLGWKAGFIYNADRPVPRLGWKAGFIYGAYGSTEMGQKVHND